MDTGIIATIITASTTIIVSVIAIINERFDWRKSVMRDIDLYNKLFCFSESVQDDLCLFMLRNRIYNKAREGISNPVVRGLGSALALSISVETILITIFYYTGKIESWYYWLLIAIVVGISSLSAIVIKILANHPRTNTNPFYRYSHQIYELSDGLEDLLDKLTARQTRDGEPPNFYLYIHYLRKKMK